MSFVDALRLDPKPTHIRLELLLRLAAAQHALAYVRANNHPGDAKAIAELSEEVKTLREDLEEYTAQDCSLYASTPYQLWLRVKWDQFQVAKAPVGTAPFAEKLAKAKADMKEVLEDA